jgi:hypothetical protein
MPLLLRFVPKRLQDRVGQMSIQNVVRAIESSARHDWIKEFKLKYAME